jgi:hypothetical protein
MFKILPNQGRLLNQKCVNMAFRTAMLMLFLVGSLVLSLFPSQGSAQKRQNYGDIWRSLDHAERRFYLGGLQEGTHELLLLRCLFDGSIPINDPIEEGIIQNLKLTPKQRSFLIQIIDKRLNEIDIEQFGTEVIEKLMTDIYGDPANTYIGFHTIAKIAVMRLKGKPEEGVNMELEISRGAAAEVMKTRPAKP